MVLNNNTLTWVPVVKYLGVHLVSGRKLSFDISPAKRSFFMACNTILSHTKHMDEIIQLSLQESHCLSWELLYADDLAVIAETEEELIKRLNDNNHLTASFPG